MKKAFVRSGAVIGALGLLLASSACSTNTDSPAPDGDGDDTSSVSDIPTSGTDAANAVEADPAVQELVPEALLEAGVIRIVNDPTYAPMEFTADDGNIVGLDADLALAAANAMGLEIEWSIVTFDGILAGIEAGRYDATFSSFSVTDDRLQSVDMVSYFSSGTAIMVPKGEAGDYTESTDLCGKTVGVQTGTTQALEILPGIDEECASAGLDAIDMMILPAQDNVNQAVASGRADAMVADNALVAYYAQLQPDAYEAVPGLLFDEAPIGVAMPKLDDGESLVPAFEAAFQSIIADGTYQAVFEAWQLQDSMLEAPEAFRG